MHNHNKRRTHLKLNTIETNTQATQHTTNNKRRLHLHQHKLNRTQQLHPKQHALSIHNKTGSSYGIKPNKQNTKTITSKTKATHTNTIMTNNTKVHNTI